MNKKQVNTLKLVSRIAATEKTVAYTKSAFAATANGLRRSFIMSLAASLLLGTSMAFSTNSTVSAAACPAPSTDLGTLTFDATKGNIVIPATANYNVWTRIMVPDASNNTIDLQIDGTNCFTINGGTTANTWTWVKLASPVSLAQGSNHVFKYIGTKPGVSLDRIIVTSDTSCTPADLGNNCETGDSTPPTVNVTAPANGQTVSGTVNITATATEAIKKMEFLVDGQVVNTDTTSPYSYAWNAAGVSNGTHTIAARATDNADNVGTSANVTVTVSGGSTQPKQGDLNNDGKVNITDLSILLTNWGKTGATPAQGDVNGSGKVDITDLSILLSRWG